MAEVNMAEVNMAEVKMNTDREWLLRMADTEANCELSAAGLAHEADLLRRSAAGGAAAPAESKRLALGRFLELSRRQKGHSLEAFAAAAGVGAVELADLEHGTRTLDEPQTLRRIASVLQIEPEPLLDLAGLLTDQDERLSDLATEFAARLEPLKPLDPGEERTLEWFRQQAFRSRPRPAAVG